MAVTIEACLGASLSQEFRFHQLVILVRVQRFLGGQSADNDLCVRVLYADDLRTVSGLVDDGKVVQFGSLLLLQKQQKQSTPQR